MEAAIKVSRRSRDMFALNYFALTFWKIKWSLCLLYIYIVVNIETSNPNVSQRSYMCSRHLCW